MAKPTISVDWEDWNDALHIEGENLIEEPTVYLINLFKKKRITAIWYILGKTAENNQELVEAIAKNGHVIGTHGYYHNHNELSTDPLFRSPYWDYTPMPSPPAGGFFFRFMPYWYVKWAVLKSRHLWLHPHDVMLQHPDISNPILNIKRKWGLKNSRKKLERLLKEVKFGKPSV